jgi:hypothetical protein
VDTTSNMGGRNRTGRVRSTNTGAADLSGPDARSAEALITTSPSASQAIESVPTVASSTA